MDAPLNSPPTDITSITGYTGQRLYTKALLLAPLRHLDAPLLVTCQPIRMRYLVKVSVLHPCSEYTHVYTFKHTRSYLLLVYVLPAHRAVNAAYIP
jgi:hypothetical protein